MPGTGPWFKRYQALARETLTPPVGWLVETNASKLYNGVLKEADGGFVGKYRKVQVNLGEQTWWGWSPDRFEQEVTEPRFAGRIDIAAQRRSPHA